MLVQDESDIELLIKLIDDTSIADPIAKLREIRLSRKADKDRYFYEQAMSTPYKFQRIIRVSAFDNNGNPRGTVDHVAEYLTVFYKDLPRFSQQAGVKTEVVQAVAEGREKQFKDKQGNVWRGFPFLWQDRTPSREDREDREADLRDDEDMRRKQASKQANKQAAFKSIQTAPIISIYG